MQLVLHHFIYIQKAFALSELNKGIEGFSYSYFNKKNKPIPLTRDRLTGGRSKPLKQDAASMHLLFRILPFLISDKVDTEKDKHWNLFKLLMKITSISFAPVIGIEKVAELKDLVEQCLLFTK